MPTIIYKNGKSIVDELGKFAGKKTIEYEISYFIGGIRKIPQTVKGTFEMQDRRVTSMKHFNICKLLGRYKATGKLFMRIEGKDDIVYGWKIADGRLKLLKKDEPARSVKVEVVSLNPEPTVKEDSNSELVEEEVSLNSELVEDGKSLNSELVEDEKSLNPELVEEEVKDEKSLNPE